MESLLETGSGSGSMTSLKSGYKTMKKGFDKLGISNHIISETETTVKIQVEGPIALLEMLAEAAEEHLKRTATVLDIASKIILMRSYESAREAFTDPDDVAAEAETLQDVPILVIQHFILTTANTFLYNQPNLDEDESLVESDNPYHVVETVYNIIKIPLSQDLREYLMLQYNVVGPVQPKINIPAGSLLVEGPEVIQ